MSSKNSGWEAYADLIDLPHPVSKNHPQMSRQARAAQFSSFAALTGLDAAMDEAGRLTDAKIDLDDSQKAAISQALLRLQEDPALTCMLTYFVPDSRKQGGAYETWTGRIRKLDSYARVVVLDSEQAVPIDDILSLTILGPNPFGGQAGTEET